MKKMVTAILVSALVMFAAGNALAAVSGQCVNCHTMHNSQGGDVMGTADPNAMLLLAGTCAGCHATGASLDNTTNGSNGLLNAAAPQVDDPEASMLAGGSFDFINSDGALYGHNVDELFPGTAIDPYGRNGADSGVDRAVATGWGSQQLTCAGTYGCHGAGDVVDKFGSIKGAHHTAPGANTGVDAGTSYRFLTGILGYEDADWQLTTSETDHNVYQGVNRASGSDTNQGTISALCAQCHGKFHAYELGTDTSVGIKSGSAWVRHPTDVVIPTDDAQYSGAVATEQVPFGVASPAAPSAWETAGNSVVCVSCHRAHGGPGEYLLRWDYGTMVAGNGTTGNVGCFTCHTNKD